MAGKQRTRRFRFGLRTRITVAFALVGLLVSAALAVLAFSLARSRLLENLNDSSETITANQARTARDQILQGGVVDEVVRDVLQAGDGFVALRKDDTWFSQSQVGFDKNRMPPEVIAALERGESGRQRYRINQRDFLVVGVSIPETDMRFIQGFPLDGVARTLSLLTTSLTLAAVVATLAAAALGIWAARRVLTPLSQVADAASALASGTLDTRLEPESDPALRRLADSFNDMADAVQDRIKREQRFASDVSHELRTPLQTLIGSIEVLDARRADMPERSQQALDLMVGQTKRFHQMVLDLLEISRLDAGVADLHAEPVQLDQFVNRVAGHYGYASLPVVTEPRWQQRSVMVDRRRLERALANLLGNAENYAGGPVGITLDSDRSEDGRLVVRIGVEDAGPGIANSEKGRIFERFARGATSRHKVGTGLGLALVHDYVHLQGGRVWVEDRPAGNGARFVIELPADEEERIAEDDR
jgi:two-component system, OmpR family, sensor histidine kinase MtrB